MSIELKEVKKHLGNISDYPITFMPFVKPAPHGAWLLLNFTRLTPNQVSFIWEFFALLGAFYIGIGGYWNMLIGILLYHFAYYLDCLDGIMARATKKTTIGGTYLDFLFSYINRGVLLLALGIGVYNSTGNIVYLWLGITSGFLLVLDNLTKLKVFETFIAEGRIDLIKKSKGEIVKGEETNFRSKNLYKKLKAYAIESLRPVNAFSLLFFAILFNLAPYYLILMAVVSVYVFSKNFLAIYKKIGNMPN